MNLREEQEFAGREGKGLARPEESGGNGLDEGKEDSGPPCSFKPHAYAG